MSTLGRAKAFWLPCLNRPPAFFPSPEMLSADMPLCALHVVVLYSWQQSRRKRTSLACVSQWLRRVSLNTGHVGQFRLASPDGELDPIGPLEKSQWLRRVSLNTGHVGQFRLASPDGELDPSVARLRRVSLNAGRRGASFQ